MTAPRPDAIRDPAADAIDAAELARALEHLDARRRRVLARPAQARRLNGDAAEARRVKDQWERKTGKPIP